MKMPSAPIENNMFAPCGMNCMVCYKHCDDKKPCAGCLKNDTEKPAHCHKCRIKDCTEKRALSYCYECTKYPCKQIKSLEKSYTVRYGQSLMANSKFVKENGLTAFMKQQKERYTCKTCGGVISIHDLKCSICRR